MSQRRSAPPGQTLPSERRRTAAEAWDALVHVLAEGDAEDDSGDTEEHRLWAEQLAERSRAQVATRRGEPTEHTSDDQAPIDSKLGKPLPCK